MEGERSAVWYWMPRALAIAGIIYLSIFALDVFQPGVPLSQELVGLFVHLIPNLVLLIVLLIAWRHELVGGMLFVLLSLAPFFITRNPWWVNAVFLSAPFLVVGLLFIANSVAAKRRVKA